MTNNNLKIANKNTEGIFYYILSLVTMTLLVSVFKKIIVHYNVGIEQAIFMRQMAILIMLFPFLLKSKFKFFKVDNLIPNLERNVIFFISTLFLYKLGGVEIYFVKLRRVEICLIYIYILII